MRDFRAQRVGQGEDIEFRLRAAILANEEDIAVTPWVRAWRRLLQNRMAVLGMVVLGIIGTACLSAPIIEKHITRFEYQEMNLAFGPQPPLTRSVPAVFKGRENPRKKMHWFGTDEAGRDLFIRVLYGGRVSFAVGLVATFISLLIGVMYGAVAGYLGGMVDQAMMRFVDVLYCLPYIVFRDSAHGVFREEHHLVVRGHWSCGVAHSEPHRPWPGAATQEHSLRAGGPFHGSV